MWILPHLHISVLNILTPDRMRFLIRCHTQTVVHTCTPTHRHSHSSRAGPDCCGWRYVVESSIIRASLWSNQVCPGVSGVQCQLSKDRPSLAGGREGHAGAFHDIRRHINPAADGWMDGRWLGRGCGFAKAHRDASSTGDGFLPSSVHPTAKWETAGGMEGALFKPHLFSANSSSEGRLASCLNILDGRVMAPDDISDVPGPWNTVIKYYQVRVKSLKEWWRTSNHLLECFQKFNLQPHSWKPWARKPVYHLLKMHTNGAHSRRTLLLSTGPAEKLKYSHAASMLPIPLRWNSWPWQILDCGVEKKSVL